MEPGRRVKRLLRTDDSGFLPRRWTAVDPFRWTCRESFERGSSGLAMDWVWHVRERAEERTSPSLELNFRSRVTHLLSPLPI